MTNNVNFEPTIQLTNTDCKITGIPISMCSAISNRLSVKAPNYWFSEKFKCGMWDGNIKFFKRPQNTFPAGLLPMVLDTLKSDFDITPRIVDLRKGAEGITLNTIDYGFKISDEKTARDYQVDAVNNIINSKVLDVPFHRGIVNIATNGVKAQPLYTKVLTPKGFITMEEVHSGMQIIGDDGKSYTVLRVFNHNLKHIYRVTLNDGTYTDCCNEHLWTVQNDGDRASNRYRTLTLEELSKTLYYGIKDPRPNWTVPVVSPVEFKENVVEIDPWLLGFLIGDGCLSHNKISFTTSESDILEKVTGLVELYGDTVKQYKNSNYCDYDITGGNLLKILRTMKILGARSYEKCIPQNYIINTYENRLQLLRGLLDADGYVSLEKSGYVEYSTTSQCLSEQVKFLVYSMGGSVNTTEKMGCYTKDGIKITTRLQYDMGLRFFNKSVIPVSSQKHTNKWVPRKKGCYKYIVDVTYLGDMPAKCIFIDNPSSLYVTDDFIVTHNTTIAEALIKEMLPFLEATRKQFLFVTHSQEIAYQAKKSIESDLKIPVGFIGDGKWECSNITVALITTLSRRTKKPEFKEIVDKTIGFVADECHHAQSTTWYDTFNLLHNASIRIGLTGTIDKTNPVNEMRLYACTGDVIAKVSNEFLIKNGFSAKPLCILFTITTPELETESYRDAYKLGIIESEERLEVIRDICKKETSDNNTVLILVERIEHGQLIYEFLKDLNRNIEFINGTVDSTTRQNMLNNTKNNNIDVLISTSVLDEGVDISGINAIIYARGMVSSRKLLQGIGRGLRKKSDGSRLRFYDFIDNMHSSLLQHSLNRYHTLKNEKFDIKMIELDKYNSMSWEEVENEK